jgi:transcriptional regulator NrdR family protein
VFSTREKPGLALSLTVRKETGRKEPFSEDKLLVSIHRCLTHRKDALEASRALSDTIARRLLPRKTAAIESSEIKLVVLEVLKRFDKPAAVFYQSHHRDL